MGELGNCCPPQEFGEHAEDLKEHGEKPEEEGEKGTGTGCGDDPNPTPPKRARRRCGTGGLGGVTPEKIVDHAALPSSSLLQDVPLQSKGQLGLQLQIFVGQKMFVVNTSDKPIKIMPGSLLCGFGKGKFDRNVGGK